LRTDRLSQRIVLRSENYAVDCLFPDMAVWTQFVTDTQSSALRLDAMRTSHPIQVPILRAEEVEEVFDAISYAKGCSVIKMLHAVVGPEHFQAGLQVYMERHQYGNTETFHLWRAWEEVSGKPISTIMHGWTTQMGCPLLECSLDAAKQTLTVKQQWFLADGSAPDDRKWAVPLFLGSSAGAGVVAAPAAGLFLEGPSASLPTTTAAFSWLKMNAGQHVPCRVAYDGAMLAALAAGVRAGELGPDDRAGLLTDALALCKAGHASMGPATMLTLLAAFKGEAHATVWEAMADVLGSVDRVLVGLGTSGEATRAAFVTFAASLVSPAADKVGWASRADDGHLGKLLRQTLVKLQAKFCAEDPVVQARARGLWDGFMAGDEACLPKDIKVSVFSIVCSCGGEAEFKQLMAHLEACDNDMDRKAVYGCIGSFPCAALKARVLDWALSGDIKLQDFFYPIGSVSSSSAAGLELTWAYFQEHFDRIRTMLKKSVAWLMDAVILSSVSGFATVARADEVEAFFAAHPLPQSGRKISQAVENIRVSAAYCERLVTSEPPIATVVAGLC
jgi:puromycin-sensitive aminopeptidase